MNVEDSNNMLKWEARKMRPRDKISKYKIQFRRYLPVEFGLLLRKYTAKSSVCQKSFYSEHFEEHGLNGVSVDEIFKEMDQIVQDLEDKIPVVIVKGRTVRARKLSRDEIMCAYSGYLKTLMGRMDAVLDTFVEKF